MARFNGALINFSSFICIALTACPPLQSLTLSCAALQIAMLILLLVSPSHTRSPARSLAPSLSLSHSLSCYCPCSSTYHTPNIASLIRKLLRLVCISFAISFLLRALSLSLCLCPKYTCICMFRMSHYVARCSVSQRFHNVSCRSFPSGETVLAPLYTATQHAPLSPARNGARSHAQQKPKPKSKPKQ